MAGGWQATLERNGMDINILPQQGNSFQQLREAFGLMGQFTPQDEERIVWIRDISRLPFVRVRKIHTHSRSRRPSYHGHGLLIGFSILRKDASPKGNLGFERRLFYLRSDDLTPDSIYKHKKFMPSDGVNPKSISPCIDGIHTGPKRKNGNNH